MVPMGERFEMRVDEDTLARLDRWRASQPDVPSRAGAMRRLADVGLAKGAGDAVQFTDGEKLLLIMMRDLYAHLKVKAAEIDPEFVASMIFHGHLWAAKWKMVGLFHGEEADPRDVRSVADVLTMWDCIERGYERLSKDDKARVRDSGKYGKEAPRFRGFDGNNETTFVSIARFLVDDLGRFSRFKGRDFNAHMPTVAENRRMLAAFQPMLQRLRGDDLSVSQIITLLKHE